MLELACPGHFVVLTEREGLEAPKPHHAAPLKKQGDVPNLLGQGLGQDEAINRGHRPIYCDLLYTLLSFWYVKKC